MTHALSQISRVGFDLLDSDDGEHEVVPRVLAKASAPRPASVAALAELAQVNSVAELVRANGYIPANTAREQNGIARGIREAWRRSRTA